MNKLNEVARMQQLAGIITEIKVNNPVITPEEMLALYSTDLGATHSFRDSIEFENALRARPIKYTGETSLLDFYKSLPQNVLNDYYHAIEDIINKGVDGLTYKYANWDEDIDDNEEDDGDDEE